MLNFEAISTERETEDKKWYVRDTSPYRTEDRRIEGVVVTFQDISEIKWLSESANRREKQQAMVAQLGMLAHTDISLNNFMDHLVRQVAHTLDVELCKILKYRPEKNDLLLVAGVGWHEGIAGSATIPDNQNSQAGYTLLQREPVIVKSLKEEKRFKGPDLLFDHGVVSGVSVVINHSKPPFGILGVHSKSYQKFNEDDANFIQSVANLLSIVIKDYEVTEALRESENRLRIAKESSELGAFEYYLEKEDTEWDPLIKKLLGYPESQVPTQESFWDRIHEDDSDRVKAAVLKSTNPKGDGHYQARFRLINSKNGKISWVQATGRTQFSHDKAVKMIGMVQDITDFKQLEISLQRAVQELKQVNERKNMFLATLGHELRNPLAAISGAVELLQVDKANEDKITSLLGRNVKMMSGMLDDLLDLARIDNGTIDLNFEILDLNKLLKDTLNEYKANFLVKNQVLKLDIPKKPLFVRGDATRLEQIFLNLIANAHKFTPEKGVIAISVKEKNKEVAINVKDNGIGIAVDPSTIFNPFTQVNPSKGNKGLGLGLAIVKRFTEMHNGEISVFSDGINQGSTFTVVLPLVDIRDNNSNGNEPSRNIDELQIKKGLRIMIVDDNVDMNKILEIKLKKVGCEITIADCASVALELVKEARPEVFLLDIGLPDMDGHDLIKEIKKEYPEPSVYIAHTGYGHEEARDKTKSSGFDYHLTKPLVMNKFLSLLEEI